MMSATTSRFLWRALLAAVLLGRLGAGLQAQTIEQRLTAPAAARDDLLFSEWRRAPERFTNHEWGFWSTAAVLAFDSKNAATTLPDAIKSAVVLDQRLWGRWDLAGDRTLYLRTRYLDVSPTLATGVAAPTIREEGLDLDLGYLDMPGSEWSLRVGRQYVSLARGLALAQRLDAVRVSYDHRQWSSRLFWGRTPSKTTDPDPAVGKMRRDFTGVELAYLTTSDHRLFGYLVLQDDRSSAALAGQGLRYNSSYTALGAEGPLTGDYAYYAEAIVERGDSADLGSATARSNIEAYVLEGDAIWRPDRRHHPTAAIGYILGSGDADRGSAFTSAAGNAGGTADRAFIGFGRLEAGVALAPRLANLGIARLAGTYKFLEDSEDRQVLQAAAYLFFYGKADPAGVISAPGATLASGDVGSELDLSLSWKPHHDLTFVVQGGRFEPGDAFPSATRTAASALYANLTYSY
ncbi:MAG: alginate export family protein [Candidatus Wallbacteria bacterium]|nr:alginate export family protein [Candidatus Wallbacteria bacterium]